MTVPHVTTDVPVVKRTLMTLSHAIERAALQPSDDGPLVVVSLFQRLPYFERERAVYQRLAERADAVVVCFVDDFRPQLHGRVDPVLLDPAEPLAREWTVVAATPRSGAFLVAVDEERTAAGERTLEAGRLFGGRWGFGAAGAHAELRRLRTALADRLPPGTLGLLDHVAASPDGTPASTGADSAVRLLVEAMERARRRAVAVQERLDAVTMTSDRDLISQLHTESYLHRWVGANRTATAGPLPLALVLICVPQLAEVSRLGTRAEREVLREAAAALTRRLREVDRAVRLSDHEFLLVLPGVGEEHAVEAAQQVFLDFDRFRDGYPYVSLAPISVVAVTRQRPLPLEELRQAARWASAEQVPIALMPA